MLHFDMGNLGQIPTHKKGKVLLTGAAGFIGSHVLGVLLELKYDVVAVDALIDSTYPASDKLTRWQNLKTRYRENCEFLKGDLSDLDFVNQLPPVDFIVNEAAVPGLMLSWENFNLYLKSNLIVTNNLIEYAKKHSVKRFVQASTSSVYGLRATQTENSSTEPISPYGVSKLAAEKLIFAHSFNFNIPYTILRYFSVYGPGQRPDMFYSIAIRKMMRGEEVQVYGDGRQTRTNTYVGDVARITAQSLSSELMANEIYNVAGIEEISVNRALSEIGQHLNTSPKILYLQKRPGDQLETKGNIEKITSTGIQVNSISFSEGIQKQIEYERRNLNAE